MLVLKVSLSGIQIHPSIKTFCRSSEESKFSPKQITAPQGHVWLVCISKECPQSILATRACCFFIVHQDFLFLQRAFFAGRLPGCSGRMLRNLNIHTWQKMQKLQNLPKNYHNDIYKVFKVSDLRYSRWYEIWAKNIANIA